MDFVGFAHPLVELNPKNHGTHLISTLQLVLDGPYL